LHQGRDDFCTAAPVAGKLKIIFLTLKKKTFFADEIPDALQVQLPQQRLQVCVFQALEAFPSCVPKH
jgi:hypothetical protein